jgi:hypothetical protein
MAWRSRLVRGSTVCGRSLSSAWRRCGRVDGTVTSSWPTSSTRCGVGPTPLPRALAVDLEQLSEILEGDPMSTGGVLDLRTGEVWPRSTMDFLDEGGDDVDAPDFEDLERFLWVRGEGSRDGYRDMVAFIDTIDDGDRGNRLGIAIQGRGAFRRFKDVLARWPDQLERWYEFSAERKRGRARAWLADIGYRVASD